MTRELRQAYLLNSTTATKMDVTVRTGGVTRRVVYDCGRTHPTKPSKKQCVRYVMTGATPGPEAVVIPEVASAAFTYEPSVTPKYARLTVNVPGRASARRAINTTFSSTTASTCATSTMAERIERATRGAGRRGGIHPDRSGGGRRARRGCAGGGVRLLREVPQPDRRRREARNRHPYRRAGARARDRAPLLDVATSSLPTHSTNPRNPRYQVNASGTGYEWDQTGVKPAEAFVPASRDPAGLLELERQLATVG